MADKTRDLGRNCLAVLSEEHYSGFNQSPDPRLHDLHTARLSGTTEIMPQVNFTFGVEIFEPGHCTKPHTHQLAHEIFFILAGEAWQF